MQGLESKGARLKSPGKLLCVLRGRGRAFCSDGQHKMGPHLGFNQGWLFCISWGPGRGKLGNRVSKCIDMPQLD